MSTPRKTHFCQPNDVLFFFFLGGVLHNPRPILIEVVSRSPVLWYPKWSFEVFKMLQHVGDVAEMRDHPPKFM